MTLISSSREEGDVDSLSVLAIGLSESIWASAARSLRNCSKRAAGTANHRISTMELGGDAGAGTARLAAAAAITASASARLRSASLLDSSFSSLCSRRSNGRRRTINSMSALGSLSGEEALSATANGALRNGVWLSAPIAAPKSKTSVLGRKVLPPVATSWA